MLYEKRLQRIIYVVKNSLTFLSTKDKPWQLFLICKDFNTSLRKEVFKMYLFTDSEYEWLHRNRVKTWLKILNVENLKLDYIEMKNEVAINAKHDQIEEIITLDVNR